MNESVVLPAREAIHSYVAHVRLHLSDLPPEELDELIGGLEADLAERATELPDGADLTSAFGAPEAYAAELRSAAGLPPRVVQPAPAPPRVSAVRQLETSGRASREGLLARHPWLADLRPVWWVARGVILGVLPLFIVGGGHVGPAFWLFAIAGAALSFWWSRREPAPSSWSNRLAILASAVAIVLALPLALTFAARSAWSDQSAQIIYSDPTAAAAGAEGVWVNGEPATSLYAYDAEGNRIDRVRLFNQYGQAVAIPVEALDRINQTVSERTGSPLPQEPDGSFDVNRVVFPIRWGQLTGWEASIGDWEPPVKITALAPHASTSADPSATATPDPGASASPSASPAPSGSAAQPSPPPTATP